MGIHEVAGLPEDGPATLAAVKEHLRITDTGDDTRLAAIVAAVNAVVRRLPVATDAVGEPLFPAHLVEAGTLMAARLFRRKNSPAGVESFGEFGATYVMRNDPDVAMLLRLGTWQPPAVG